MAGRLAWDKSGERYYETGVNRGVLYVRDENGEYSSGVVWNGLTEINESPSGADATPLWADNIKYLNLMSTEEFGATINAYTYPDEFMACDGTVKVASGVYMGQQNRKTFGLSYTTKLGNDIDGDDHGYKIHLVYGCLASTSDKSYSTVNDSPDAITFSWEVNTTPVESNIDGVKPSATLVINSTEIEPEKLKEIEDILYGSDATVGPDDTPIEAKEARLPMPDEIIALLATA